MTHRQDVLLQFNNLVRIRNCKQTGKIPQSQLINMQVKDNGKSISPLIPSAKCIPMSQRSAQHRANVSQTC